MKKSIRTLAILSVASLGLIGCSTTQVEDDSAFPYFGEIVPKTEVKDATLVDAPPPPPAIWAETEDGLRHVVSGAICPDAVAGFERIREQDYPGLPRGYDVVCLYGGPQAAEMKLHMTHFGREVSLDAHIKGVDGTIAETYPVLGRVAPPSNVFGKEIAARRSGFRLRAATEDDPLGHTVTWLEDIAGWHVKVRATYVETEAQPIGVAAGELYQSIRADIKEREALIAANLP